MKVSVAIVLLSVAVTAYAASIDLRSQTLSLSPAKNELQTGKQKESSLSRSRRWILSWLVGHGFLPNYDNEDDKKEETPAANTRVNNLVSSVEVVNLPGTNQFRDLSGDTRVNYQDGHGRTSALANEGDAEVFDWRLLQEDRERNNDNFNVNPHYYAFHSKDEESQDLKQPAQGLYSGPYGRREVVGTGFIGGSNRYNSGARSSSISSSVEGVRTPPVFRGSTSSRGNLRKFNRTPIAYDDSLQYISSSRRYRQPRN